ncbi:MAG: hypothetical protein JJU00_05975 [Opitutales bacterium]|nr:hypothetical protein [Opitutales bacterium]
MKGEASASRSGNRVNTALRKALLRAAETGGRKLAVTSVQRLHGLNDADWERLRERTVA